MALEKVNIVKVGGQVVEEPETLAALLDAFKTIPGKKILVTGGGRRATAVASELGIESHMVDGRRITDEPMLRVVTMVYAGLVGKNIVAQLQSRGVNAIGLSGADLNIIRCDKRPVKDTPAGPVDYGFVGDVKSINVEQLKNLLDFGAVPVFCPITHDGDGQLLNTNADTIASSVACALASVYDVTLTFCFEKKGVLSNPDDEDSVISHIRRDDFKSLCEKGVVNGGMIPKLENSLAAVDAGVKKVVITNALNLGKDSGTVIL